MIEKLSPASQEGEETQRTAEEILTDARIELEKLRSLLVLLDITVDLPDEPFLITDTGVEGPNYHGQIYRALAQLQGNQAEGAALCLGTLTMLREEAQRAWLLEQGERKLH